MFYDTYGKDSYIIAGNFDYSQNTVNGIQKCGFSRKVLRKSYNYIRKQKINYMIIDPRNNYRIDEKSDNRNLNEYEEQAKKHIQ